MDTRLVIEICIALCGILLSSIGALWLSVQRLHQTHARRLETALEDMRGRTDADGRLLVSIHAIVDDLPCRRSGRCPSQVDIFAGGRP